MADIRILVVDDSGVVRRILGDIIKNEPGMTLVGTANNGADALKQIKELEPDLMTLGLEMPIMGGLEVLAQLRRERSRMPVIVVSSLTQRGSSATLEALTRGASDYVSKPTSSGDPCSPRVGIRSELVPRIVALAAKRARSQSPRSQSPRSQSPRSQSPGPEKAGSVRSTRDPGRRSGDRALPRPLPTPPTGFAEPRPATTRSDRASTRLPGSTRSSRRGPVPRLTGRGVEQPARTGAAGPGQSSGRTIARGRPGVLPPRAVVIGSSTGGPAALETVLAGIRTPLNIPMFIVQHIPAEFSAMLAKRLDSASAMTVVEATSGQVPKAGTVYLAPGGRHMVLTKKDRRVTIKLTDTPPVNSCRPAVDVLFESSADVYGSDQLAVILTGMGHDGLDGCKKLFPLGVPVIAQDEETCVVWGMPRFVTEEGLTDEVVPLGQIAERIIVRVSGRDRAGAAGLASSVVG